MHLGPLFFLQAVNCVNFNKIYMHFNTQGPYYYQEVQIACYFQYYILLTDVDVPSLSALIHYIWYYKTIKRFCLYLLQESFAQDLVIENIPPRINTFLLCLHMARHNFNQRYFFFLQGYQTTPPVVLEKFHLFLVMCH